MKKYIYLLIFVFCSNVYSYSGDLHLHLKDFKSSFSNVNFLVEDFLNSDAMKVFKSSKLYLRLKKEFKTINDSNFFSYKNLKKLSAKKLDLYLLNTADLDFLLAMQLDISQLTALVNLDLNTYQEINGEKYYKLGSLYFIIKEQNIVVSTKRANITKYLDNPKEFVTITPSNKYDNFLYLNMKKILSDYYLKTYWFNRHKDFSFIGNKVEVYFSTRPKKFDELIKIYTNENPKYDKWFFKDNNSILIKQKNLSHRLFSKNKKLFKDISIYGVSINEKHSNYIAKPTDKEKLKQNIKKEHPNAKITDKSGVLEVKYGLMNRNSAYLKFNDNYLLISSDNNFNEVSKSDYYEYIKIDKDLFSQLNKKLEDLNSNASDYSYKQFYKNFLTMYIKKLKSFSYSSKTKEDKQITIDLNISFK